MKKFKRSQVQNQKSIKRYLETNVIETSSSDDETEELLETAVKNVLSNYQYEGGNADKTFFYLTEAFRSDGLVCLICISSIKKSDQIWSCTECYTFLHLHCIQHWVRDSLSYKHEKGITPLWGCPKCRTEYQENEIPRKYLCFCGKIEDPPYHPWSIPHSCGNICEKLLQPKCGHKCMLLCHPGSCPPCPKMVSVTCYCRKQVPCSKRCNTKEWSCGKLCDKKYKSCEHECKEICHSGNCPPCSKIILSACNCKNKYELRKCNDSFWFCDKICGRHYSCNVHVCEDFCHKPGDCNVCPLEFNRTCPCGKKKYAVSCKQLQIPTCGDTCGKLLNCKVHYCNMRCHTEGCGQCLEVITKTCRCGNFSKELPCIKEFYCNKKCPQLRLCGIHLCNKKCCDCFIQSNFNACEKVCDNTLNCRKHKCFAPCHRGPCYPCPRTAIIQCRCGHNKITVPCGTVKKIKPPNCNKKCKIPPICHHLKRESHKCHQGVCPPCQKVCKLIHKRCNHVCLAICHTKVWTKIKANGNLKPIGPWENVKDKWEYKSFSCPPCEVSITVTCLGGHEKLLLPCHKAISTSCLRQCGQLLACTNHRCEKMCHKLELLDNSSNDQNQCMVCEKPCILSRPEGCTHPCTKFCHPAPCELCTQLVKVPCHCGINILYIRCTELTSASSKKRKELLMCGNQCPRNYPCGHRCIDNCHVGPCQKSEFCNKKVKVLCKCKRIKKDFSCILIRAREAIVNCDEICHKKKEELNRIREIEQEKKRKEEERKNQKEIEMFEKKFKPKRRGKDRHYNKEQVNDRKSSYKWLWFMIVKALFVIGISVAAIQLTFETKIINYFTYKS